MLQRKHTPFYNQSQEIRLFLSTEPSITSSLLAAASSSFYFRKKDLLTKEKKLQDDEANHTHTHTKVYLKQFGTHLENLTFS